MSNPREELSRAGKDRAEKLYNMLFEPELSSRVFTLPPSAVALRLRHDLVNAQMNVMNAIKDMNGVHLKIAKAIEKHSCNSNGCGSRKEAQNERKCN